MCKKIKVLFVAFSLGFGGAEKALCNLLSKLDYSRLDVDLLLMKRAPEREALVDKRVTIVDTPADLAFMCGERGVGYHPPVSQVLRKAACFAELKAKGLDTGCYAANQLKWKHIWSPSLSRYPSSYDVAVGYLHGYPNYYVIDKVEASRKYLWIHTDYAALNADDAIERSYLSKADRVFSVSEACVSSLETAFPNMVGSFALMPNVAVSNQMNLTQSEETELSDDDGIVKILSVGRLVELKNFQLAVDAAGVLAREGMKFKWAILGEGPLRNQLQRQIDEAGLTGSVLLLGVRSNPYPYYQSADVVVQTSLYEGKSVVLDEAKLAGKAVVCTRYASAEDQVEDEVSGYLCSFDAVDVARAIARAAECGAPKGLTGSLESLRLESEKTVELHMELLAG